MATRLMDEKAYAAHQARFGKQVTPAPAAAPKPKKRAKYGNEPVIEDGLRMMSRREMRRYRELGLLLKARKINFLARQVRFILQGNIEYVADFVYGKAISGEITTDFGLTVEDVKSASTLRLDAFRMKKRLMFEKYGLEIVEII